MNVGLIFIEIRNSICDHLVRHTLYEQPTQHIPKIKRMETVSGRKISAGIERQFTRECKRIQSFISVSLLHSFEFLLVTLPSQNIQITSVRSVQFKVYQSILLASSTLSFF